MSLPKRFVFAFLIFVICAIVTGAAVALIRPIVIKLGFIARVIAALFPIGGGLWFAVKAIKVTRDRDMGLGEVLKSVFGADRKD